MPVTFKPLARGQLTATDATLYTTPASTTTRLTEIAITNTDTVERTVTIRIVPSGGASGVDDDILSALPIASKQTIVLDLKTVLATGDFITGAASVTTVVNVRISGAEIT